MCRHGLWPTLRLTEPLWAVLAQALRLFRPLLPSVPQILKTDVTLILSVDTHWVPPNSEFKSSPASIKTNNQYAAHDVTVIISFVMIALWPNILWFKVYIVYILCNEECVSIYSNADIYLLLYSDMLMEESQTTCLSMSWKTPSLCPHSLERVISVPATLQPTYTSCVSPTQASSSLSPTSTESPELFSLQTQW